MLHQAILTSTNHIVPTRRQKVNFYVIVSNAHMPEFAITPENALTRILVLVEHLGKFGEELLGKLLRGGIDQA